MLKGTLDDFTLPDIFRLLSMAKRTGALDVARSAGTGRIFFRDGDVYFAESSLTREPLGQKLIRARAVTEGQLMKALDAHAAGGGRVGEILVAAGALTLDQLEVAVKEQIEDSVFDLLRWELGDFQWEPGDEVEVEVPIIVSVENLIMEASRRLDELEVIKRKIPSVDSVLRMAPKPPEGAVEINITPEEWRILVLVDGSRDVAAIAEAVALDEFGAMRVLYGLVAAGLIELASGERAELVDEAEPLQEVTPRVELEAFVEPEPRQAAEPMISLGVDLSPASNGNGTAPEAPAPAADLDDDLLIATGDDDEPDLAADDAALLIGAADEAAPEPAFTDEARAFEPELPAEADEPSLDEPAPAFSVETFDAPSDDELTMEVPPEAEAAAPEPAAEVPATPEPSIDRAAVVRELAGLFGDDDRPRPQRAAMGERPAQPQRLEDDDQLTKGLISRLIDGVKGL
jgi:uncharacterized protein DUF4388